VHVKNFNGALLKAFRVFENKKETSDMLAEKSMFLEEAFDKLNSIYFNGELPTVAITIMSSPRSNAHISVQKIWKSDEEYYHELNLSAEHIHRSIDRVMVSLVHEMTHLYCMEQGIKDVSNGGRYHNNKFKAEAERRDLDISYDKTIGWSITNPTVKFIDTLKANGLYGEDFNLYRTTGRPLDPAGGGVDGNNGAGTDRTGKKKSSTRKYICLDCPLQIRATRDVRVICADCRIMLVKVTA
jgi:hypothetical protein